jgi:8-oxo-dGTP diphosphatase
MTIFAQTQRLTLRALRKDELPRMVELIGVWDVVRWLSVVPFPYRMRDAEEFYADMEPHNKTDTPQFFVMALKKDDLLLGGIGLHPPRNPGAEKGEIEIGYWLGRPYWGHGLMAEATQAVLAHAFARPTTRAVSATADLENIASQKVLRKMGLHLLGAAPRQYQALRGNEIVMNWRLTREDYQPDQLTAGAA